MEIRAYFRYFIREDIFQSTIMPHIDRTTTIGPVITSSIMTTCNSIETLLSSCGTFNITCTTVKDFNDDHAGYPDSYTTALCLGSIGLIGLLLVLYFCLCHEQDIGKSVKNLVYKLCTCWLGEMPNNSRARTSESGRDIAMPDFRDPPPNYSDLQFETETEGGTNNNLIIRDYIDNITNIQPPTVGSSYNECVVTSNITSLSTQSGSCSGCNSPVEFSLGDDGDESEDSMTVINVSDNKTTPRPIANNRTHQIVDTTDNENASAREYSDSENRNDNNELNTNDTNHVTNGAKVDIEHETNTTSLSDTDSALNPNCVPYFVLSETELVPNHVNTQGNATVDPVLSSVPNVVLHNDRQRAFQTLSIAENVPKCNHLSKCVHDCVCKSFPSDNMCVSVPKSISNDVNAPRDGENSSYKRPVLLTCASDTSCKSYTSPPEYFHVLRHLDKYHVHDLQTSSDC